MSNEINEVYILNRHKQGTYILKDIPFNTTPQSEDDIFIENTGYNFLDNRYPNLWHEHRFYGISDNVEDISKILKVTYDTNDTLKSVEVLKDGIFYPYIYRNLSDNEIEEKIKECIIKCSNDIIFQIKENFMNDILSRIFIYAYWDSGNDVITFYIGNKKNFDTALNSPKKSKYQENINNPEFYMDKELAIHDNKFLVSLTYYFFYVNQSNWELYHIDSNLGKDFKDRFIKEIEENILKEVGKIASFTDDFKFIYELVD